MRVARLSPARQSVKKHGLEPAPPLGRKTEFVSAVRDKVLTSRRDFGGVATKGRDIHDIDWSHTTPARPDIFNRAVEMQIITKLRFLSGYRFNENHRLHRHSVNLPA
ncbi:MAG: hypothetical protein JWL90_2801 [Chthoniobacteraceae bacterium]|nr:hypothetical protein [Chthoniobacteraceae bacterium]